MTGTECLKILRDIKDVAFATVDEKGKPQVRIIDIMLVEENKVYFCTARGKDFYRQLIRTQEVAVTGMNAAYQMVRLWGRARRAEEQKYWIDRIFEENPSMKEVYPKDSRYILEAFYIESGTLEFFDLGKTPVFRESYVLGQAPEQRKGFQISSGCIGCGTCQQVCPQQCIQEGVLYRINEVHCLHCGLCYENCPVGAVERMGE